MNNARMDELIEAYLSGQATLAQAVLDGLGVVEDYTVPKQKPCRRKTRQKEQP